MPHLGEMQLDTRTGRWLVWAGDSWQTAPAAQPVTGMIQEWGAGRLYQVGDIVASGRTLYRCQVMHTTGHSLLQHGHCWIPIAVAGDLQPGPLPRRRESLATRLSQLTDVMTGTAGNLAATSVQDALAELSANVSTLAVSPAVPAEPAPVERRGRAISFLDEKED